MLTHTHHALLCLVQCLNYTKLAPSKRSAYDLDCAYDKGPNSACPKRGSFNSKKPV